MMWILVAVGSVVGIFGLMALLGLLLPVSHLARCRADLRQSPEAVWQAITDIDRFPEWRRDLERIERLPDRDGLPAWVEHGKNGRMPMKVVDRQPPHRLVGAIDDRKLPFGGSWTYEIAPRAGGCTITITEDGEVYNPLFRFMARFVFGHHATLKQYLASLGNKFGEDVQVRVVA